MREHTTQPKSSGLMMYCFRHDEGFLIEGTTQPKYYDACNLCLPHECHTENNRCTIKKVGHYNIHEHNIVSLKPFHNYDQGGGWKNSYYLENMYTSDLKKIHLPDVKGIVLNCFTHERSIFLLSKTLPSSLIKIDCPCKKSRESCEWEDTATFTLSNNIVRWKKNEKEYKDVEMYTDKLERIT